MRTVSRVRTSRRRVDELRFSDARALIAQCARAFIVARAHAAGVSLGIADGIRVAALAVVAAALTARRSASGCAHDPVEIVAGGIARDCDVAVTGFEGIWRAMNFVAARRTTARGAEDEIVVRSR